MRAFIVLCLIAAACADVSSLTGYNYQSGDSGHQGGSGGSGGGQIGGGGSGGHFGGGSSGGQAGGADGGASGGFGGDGGSAGEGSFDKEFYSFTANDEDFHPSDDNQQLANSLKKSLRVIFIKGPENKALENAALSLAKSSSDQKTAIYILNKQTDIGELANKLNAENSHSQNKPEVHFVKYRTPEDAQNAQHQIQSQYDSLGGTSQSHDGGVAPVLNFASQGHSGAGPEHGGYSHSHPGNANVPSAAHHVSPPAAPSNSYIPAAAPGNSYIPPSIFRSLRL